MKWTDKFNLFLFDFDGLLVNTEPIHFQAYSNLLLKKGFKLDWNFQKYCSFAHAKADGLKEITYSKFPKLLEMEPNWENLKKEKSDIYFSLILDSKIELMEGVETLLKILHKKNKKMCVVTNSKKEQIDAIVHENKVLKLIKHFVTRESYIKPKPDPESYLQAIKLYAKKEDKIIGFEDSIRGINALLKTPAISILIGKHSKIHLEDIISKGALCFSSFKDIKESL